ncbi:hypothetical protein CVIRNUC_006151 [Coccomyxa viridis]|uniref:Uncharacterized protein n=1 Tax=Coccomyxa viridis TaxID=1274662 RepID=A0AAV1I6H3_9CHLO|nr:hypothetical protein CVIRNUC_006151 [Coccomyxa viridis]
MGNAAETGRLHATAALPHSQQQTERQTLCLCEAMIYDVNSVLFRSFLASGGGSHGSGVRKDNRKQPNEKSKDNKPPLTE